MIKASMSAYKAQIEKYGIPISSAQYEELRSYASEHSIVLSNFRDYTGDISTIKLIIDDIFEIAYDFPLIIDNKKGICLELSYDLGLDFATTDGHVIRINGGYFTDVTSLEREYDEAVSKGRFVKGTDWRAIARHETGHVVANLYHVRSMDIAMDILNTKSRIAVVMHLRKNLSLYSVEMADGKEIISECFSAYYSKVDNAFANEFLRKVGEYI